MIFIDTGAFVARYIQSDQYHKKAQQLWVKLSRSSKKIFTSSHVVDETLTLLARKAGYSFASQRGQNILLSETLTILRPTHEDEISALDIFEKYADQKVSFTDCISFILMKKNKIKLSFSFDRHFKLAGFTPWT